MGNDKNVPKLRFPGFTDTWEQRKFDEWGDFYYGHSCPKWSVTEDATTPCIRYGELYTKFGAKIDKVYSYTNMPPEKLRFSKGTEVLIPRVGEDPMDYNHCTWLSLKGVAIGEMISVFNTDQDPLFSATMFNATLQKEFAIRVEGGSVTNLYFDKLRNIDISYPSLQEQKKIAAFFENIDYLITLHQRKNDEMKALKKCMLQKMFPKKGEKVPEIRFPEFTDDWEQRKLLDCLTQPISDGPHETPDLVDEGIPFISVDAIVDNKIDFERKRGYITEKYDLECRKKYSPQRDDVYLVKSGSTVGKVAIVETDERFNIWSPLAAMRPNKEILVPKYLYYFLQLDDIQDEVSAKSKGGTQPNLSMRILEKFIVRLPDVDEQKKISDALSNLDNLITLHQRKLDQIKLYKEYLLQNMFV